MAFILLYGLPGSGKTTLAASMTHLGYKVRFIDVDDKVRLMENLRPELERGTIKVTPILSKLTESSMREAIMTPKKALTIMPQGYLEICDAVTKYEEDIKKGEFPQEQVLVIDSLTSMTEHMKRLIAHIQGKSHFTYDEWAIILSNLEEFFYIMKGLLEVPPEPSVLDHPGFKHVIIIAHETTERDETTGRIQTLPCIEGQMRHKVGKYFEEVYYCLVELTKTGVPVYKVLTVATERYTARSSRTIPAWIESDFSIIFGKKKGKELDPIKARVTEARNSSKISKEVLKEVK